MSHSALGRRSPASPKWAWLGSDRNIRLELVSGFTDRIRTPPSQAPAPASASVSDLFIYHRYSSTNQKIIRQRQLIPIHRQFYSPYRHARKDLVSAVNWAFVVSSPPFASIERQSRPHLEHRLVPINGGMSVFGNPIEAGIVKAVCRRTPKGTRSHIEWLRWCSLRLP